MQDLKNILEALLFVSGDPLTISRIRQVLPEVNPGEVREAMKALSEEYEARGGGFYLMEVGGGFQLRTRPVYKKWIKSLTRTPSLRLSRQALETLAIIAWNQPIIRSDIEHIRGVDSGGVLRQLLERKLIRVVGRKEIPGRPLIYGTTRQFLEMFELKDLRDLPTPREIEGWEEKEAENGFLPQKQEEPEPVTDESAVSQKEHDIMESHFQNAENNPFDPPPAQDGEKQLDNEENDPDPS